MNWIKDNKKVNSKVLIGLFLIIVGLSIWIYSAIELISNEVLLANQNIPIEEVWRAEGALQWWKNVYATAIIPATTILTLSGIAALLGPVLLGSFKQRIAFNKFENKLKEAYQITPE